LIETDPSKGSAIPTDWCLWLSSKKSEGINAKKNIRVVPSAANELIAQTGTSQWIITKRLNQEVALRNNLTMQLATLLLAEENLEDKISINDQRIVSDSIAWGNANGGKKTQASIQQEPADRYLVVLLLTLLVIERILAYQRNQ
jgi:hypothetical protein